MYFYLSPNDCVERMPGGLQCCQAQPINEMSHVSRASSLFFSKERACVSSLMHQSNHCETFSWAKCNLSDRERGACTIPRAQKVTPLVRSCFGSLSEHVTSDPNTGVCKDGSMLLAMLCSTMQPLNYGADNILFFQEDELHPSIKEVIQLG
jgi:hypothetical protein